MKVCFLLNLVFNIDKIFDFGYQKFSSVKILLFKGVGYVFDQVIYMISIVVEYDSQFTFIVQIYKNKQNLQNGRSKSLNKKQQLVE